MTNESNLVQHARKELELAALFDKDADYGGALAPHILEIIKVFSLAEHSGGSAAITISILEKLLRFKTLTPITSNPEEWMDVSSNLWQNTRDPSCFSKDEGKTWYDINKKNEHNNNGSN